MHGKIVQYSHTTGIGIIINASKKLFDFKLSSWHDSTKIPEIGLLVEFRTEDDGVSVIDVRSSKYQDFDEDSIIKERDFWKTNSDSDLEKLEANVFDEIITQTYKSTDYLNLKEIPTSIDIYKFIEYHFQNEMKIIKFSYKLQMDDNGKLDYRIVNKFVKRALDALIYTDKRITKDHFSIHLEIIKKLEYFTTPFYISTQATKKVFNEVFLLQQLYFNAAMRKLNNIKDDLLSAENKKRNINAELNRLNLVIKNAKNKQEIKDKISSLHSQYIAYDDKIKIILKTKENVSHVLDSFIKKYENQFIKVFEESRTKIFLYIKNALNIVITSLDNKIWQLGMNSDPIKNHFFKIPSSYSFSTLAFMQQYIRTLDASKLSDNDRTLSIYLNRYKEKNTKKILIVSNNSDLELSLKIDILKKYKNYYVSTINKKMEYLIIIQNQKFDFIIIDNNMKEDKPIEMIMSGKSTKHNNNSTFILYQTLSMKK